tara:strand:+ start:342 stop:2249 length:1908 start_codon:yes stop_codon:yes gene_type:complete
MSVIGHSPLAGASGAAGGGDPLYVDDVFSTFLYDGTGSTQSINNGIDLSGKGGLVWIKSRGPYTNDHFLADTERGATKYLVSNSTSAEATTSGTLTSFNSNGFTLGSNSIVNGSSKEIVSWTFRKAPKFFDVVTYSGTGSAQNISHSLGSVPGMIIIHCRDGSHDWEVYHRSTGATKNLHLNNTDAVTTDSTVWNNTTPTSSVFTVGTSSSVNQNGHGYVAYIFAHDEQAFGADSDEAIIKCGSFTSPSSGNFAVDLGFEPQWLMVKRTSSAGGSWVMRDVMRGWKVNGFERLFAESSQAEDSSWINSTYFPITSTGFSTTTDWVGSNATSIYIAIRRPHKPPAAGTEVYKPVLTTSQPVSVGFPTDLIITAETASGAKYWVPRLTQKRLQSSDTSSENDMSSYFKFDLQNSFTTGSWWGSSQTINWYLRRAPSFFDVVTYTGTGSARTVSHNLNVAPELMIVKARDRSESWPVYISSVGATGALYLNSSGDVDTGNYYWNDTAPAAQQFTVGTLNAVNRNTTTYIAYLFATLNGISKVGSYSGSSGNVDVDCGFSSGARFILIKRTNSSGDWYVWDSTRGIVSGNDPYILLNSTAAQVTNTDYIDPLNAGFTVTSSAPSALNTSGGTYLFFAIA